jgi:hypothetical protein
MKLENFYVWDRAIIYFTIGVFWAHYIIYHILRLGQVK